MAPEGLDPRGAYNPYEVIIRLKERPPHLDFKKGSDIIFGVSSLDDVLRPNKVKEIRKSRPRKSSSLTFTVVFSKSVDIPKLVNALKKNAFVEDASPHYIKHLTTTGS